jgi:hypothetical protein
MMFAWKSWRKKNLNHLNTPHSLKVIVTSFTICFKLMMMIKIDY